tara:strand:- start:1141 stop:1674 length:534 start_codon:yes stop_codon:yes gene_type:complete
MTALINDLKRLGLIHGKGSGKDPGPRGGTGSSNSPDEILKRLLEKQPKLKRLMSVLKKKSKTKKTMKAAKGGAVNVKRLTKAQFENMTNEAIDALSFEDAQYLMDKFMPFIGKGEDDMLERRKGGMTMKKKGYAMGGAMKKKGYAMGGAMKKKGYAKGGAMNKRMGHSDMRKGGMFK